MNNKRYAFLIVVLGMSLLSLQSEAQSRDSLRSDFGIELLGKGLIYTFSYQHMVTSNVGIHGSLEALGGSDALVVAIPVGANLYFVNKDGSPFVTAGLSLLTGSVDVGDVDSALYGFGGLGFEYRSMSGFVFRGTAYALVYSGEFLIWPGLHVGYAF